MPRDAKPTSSFEKLQFFTSLLEHSGLRLDRVNEVFSDQKSKQHKHRLLLNKILDSIEFSDELRWSTFAGVVQRLFVVESLMQSRSIMDFLRPDRLFIEESNVRAKIETALRVGYDLVVKNDLLDGRDIRDGLRPPQLSLHIRRLSLSAVVNALSFWHLGMILDIPPVSILEFKSVPPELGPQPGTAGVRRSAEALTQYFWKYAALDVAVDKARLVFFSYLIVSGVLFVHQQFGTAADFIRPFLIAPMRLEQVQRENFTADRIRSIQFESWRESFFDLEGHWPDPKVPEEMAEIELVRRRLSAMSETELRAQYSQATTRRHKHRNPL